MATMYDSVLKSILDRLIPQRTIVRRPRPSDPWFDSDCWQVKRVTRRLERAYSAASHRTTSGTGSTSSADAAKAVWYDQRRQYRQLLNAKRSAFWCSAIEADRGSPRKLWQTVDHLLGCGKLSASSTISVDDFSQFFRDKVNLVREKTAGAPEPLFSSARHEASLSEFSAVLVSDVVAAILRLPDKSSIADALPVSLMKQIADWDYF